MVQLPMCRVSIVQAGLVWPLSIEIGAKNTTMVATRLDKGTNGQTVNNRSILSSNSHFKHARHWLPIILEALSAHIKKEVVLEIGHTRGVRSLKTAVLTGTVHSCVSLCLNLRSSPKNAILENSFGAIVDFVLGLRGLTLVSTENSVGNLDSPEWLRAGPALLCSVSTGIQRSRWYFIKFRQTIISFCELTLSWYQRQIPKQKIVFFPKLWRILEGGEIFSTGKIDPSVHITFHSVVMSVAACSLHFRLIRSSYRVWGFRLLVITACFIGS